MNVWPLQKQKCSEKQLADHLLLLFSIYTLSDPCVVVVKFHKPHSWIGWTLEIAKHMCSCHLLLLKHLIQGSIWTNYQCSANYTTIRATQLIYFEYLSLIIHRKLKYKTFPLLKIFIAAHLSKTFVNPHLQHKPQNSKSPIKSLSFHFNF